MTQLLQKAFAEAAKLPTEEQEQFAALMLEELASEKRWTELFAKSQGKLSEMASEALAEFRRGETKPLDELLGDERDVPHD